MTKTLTRVESPPLVLHLRPAIDMSDEQFLEFCGLNGDLRIERTAEGDLEIMPPAEWETSTHNAAISAQLWAWSLKDGTGVASDSSGGFRLPNSAIRAPDAAWVRKSRLQALTASQKKGFLPLCPDFVIEVRSPSDRLRTVQAKMREYIEQGAALGWLIDGPNRRVYVYRPHAEVERLDDPSTLSGDPELPGFVLDLKLIWTAGDE
ncbi:MAG TPA: Uma2 family endonuclease [Thermomicrobiales bacterium]|nr:Uma2 family endonuclease [Thermomicrobiales bacterium]